MEAIVIVFSGECLPNQQEVVVDKIARAIQQHTTAEGANSLSVTLIDNESMSKILAMQSINKENVKTSFGNLLKVPFSSLLTDFCNKIISVVGDPTNFSNESTYKVEFVKRILNDAELRQHNTDVLKYLITTGKIHPVYKNILNDYHLSNIPMYLKEINTILNLF